MTDIDLDLKDLFNKRLSALDPPSPLIRRRRSDRGNRGTLVAAALAALALAGSALVFEVNSVAASGGAACASFPSKVQIWAKTHANDLFASDHTAASLELARMVAATGCSPHDQSHDLTHPGNGPHH